MKLNKYMFREYDIRGVYGKDIDEEITVAKEAVWLYEKFGEGVYTRGNWFVGLESSVSGRCRTFDGILVYPAKTGNGLGRISLAVASTK